MDLELALGLDPNWLEVRSPMENYEARWIPMEPYGALWSPIEPYGVLWSPMELYGALWSPMEPYGALWSPMESFGAEPYGAIWSHMEPYEAKPTSRPQANIMARSQANLGPDVSGYLDIWLKPKAKARTTSRVSGNKVGGYGDPRKYIEYH